MFQDGEDGLLIGGTMQTDSSLDILTVSSSTARAVVTRTTIEATTLTEGNPLTPVRTAILVRPTTFPSTCASFSATNFTSLDLPSHTVHTTITEVPNGAPFSDQPTATTSFPPKSSSSAYVNCYLPSAPYAAPPPIYATSPAPVGTPVAWYDQPWTIAASWLLCCYSVCSFLTLLFLVLSGRMDMNGNVSTVGSAKEIKFGAVLTYITAQSSPLKSATPL
jgi:hypothetical protein